MGNYDQGRPGVPLRTASLRLRSMEKRLGENFSRTSAGPSSLECIYPYLLVFAAAFALVELSPHHHGMATFHR